jgi:hypothetical protein
MMHYITQITFFLDSCGPLPAFGNAVLICLLKYNMLVQGYHVLAGNKTYQQYP